MAKILLVFFSLLILCVMCAESQTRKAEQQGGFDTGEQSATATGVTLTLNQLGYENVNVNLADKTATGQTNAAPVRFNDSPSCFLEFSLKDDDIKIVKIGNATLTTIEASTVADPTAKSVTALVEQDPKRFGCD